MQAKYLGTAKANPSDSAPQIGFGGRSDVDDGVGAVDGSDRYRGDVVGDGDTVECGGHVQFKDNGTNVGSPVPVSNGAATMQYAFTTAGNRNITATFTSGSGFAETTSAPQPVAVSAPAVQTTIAMQVPPTAETGTAVTLTANLTPAMPPERCSSRTATPTSARWSPCRTGRRSSVTPSPPRKSLHLRRLHR
ncbi:hypothetical protein GS438_13760 [Rhodococcus hoagii]|nr:hypothetical protein [Prescottella equi]